MVMVVTINIFFTCNDQKFIDSIIDHLHKEITNYNIEK